MRYLVCRLLWRKAYTLFGLVIVLYGLHFTAGNCTLLGGSRVQGDLTIISSPNFFIFETYNWRAGCHL